MTVKERIKAFSELGNNLSVWLDNHKNAVPSILDTPIRKAFHHNGWFDEPQVVYALNEVASWLSIEKLEQWVLPYNVDVVSNSKIVGVIMAGNIPLVGYHDYLSVVMSGHKLHAKLSSKDEVLIKFLHDELLKIQPKFETQVDFSTERFTNVDAVIATGSNNSSKYFDYYFSKIPNIIRKNRTSVAILSGNETDEELKSLGDDIFGYYGLGCRNVTKVFVPKGFEVSWFYNGIVGHYEVINNHKYRNNYDYHKSVFMLNQDKIWDNNFLILKQDKGLSSPVGTLYYEEYSDVEALKLQLQLQEDQIQCKVGYGNFDLGQAQKPDLTDYSDNIDVLNFLLGL